MAVWTFIAFFVGILACLHARTDAARQRRRGAHFADLAFTGSTWCLGAAAGVVGVVVSASAVRSGDAVVALSSLLAYSGTRLSLVDIDTHTIPRRSLVRLTVVALPVVVAAHFVDPHVTLAGACVGAFVAWCAMRLVEAVSRGAMGAADAVFAAHLGLYVGAHNPYGIPVFLLSAFLAGGSVATVLLVARRLVRTSYLPFGPFLFFGALVAVLR